MSTAPLNHFLMDVSMRIPDLARYRYCPFDGSELQISLPFRKCPKPECGFVDYCNPKPCVAALIEKDDGLLLGRRAIEPQLGKWDIIGGFIDAGESAEDAVVREVFEETGLRLSQITFLTSIADVYGSRQIPTLNLCFVAIPECMPHTADSDIAALKPFSADELPLNDMAFDHQVDLLRLWKKMRYASVDVATGNY